VSHAVRSDYRITSPRGIDLSRRVRAALLPRERSSSYDPEAQCLRRRAAAAVVATKIAWQSPAISSLPRIRPLNGNQSCLGETHQVLEQRGGAHAAEAKEPIRSRNIRHNGRSSRPTLAGRAASSAPPLQTAWPHRRTIIPGRLTRFLKLAQRRYLSFAI
jgi:hypothetical protein